MMITPLDGPFGAEITDVDLREPLSPGDVEAVHEAWVDHQLIVFREQQLDEQQQIEAMRQFGPLLKHPLKSNTSQFAEITTITNVSRDGKPLGYAGPPFELWHSDLCYLERTAKMTALYAHTPAKRNGETWFADMYAAYDHLPEHLREQVEGRRAVFSLDERLVSRCAERGYDLKLADEDIDHGVLHPVIRTHPHSGRNAIFVNWAHTDSIEGYDDHESAALLEAIYEHCRDERFVYRYHYERGDLAIWDNASTLHTHCPSPPEGDRIMYRVVVEGSRPFYEAPTVVPELVEQS